MSFVRRIIVLECHEGDDPDCVEAFLTYVNALQEIVGQTLYDVKVLSPDPKNGPGGEG